MSETLFAYRLSKSVLRITAHHFVVTDKLQDPTSTKEVCEAVAELITVPDLAEGIQEIRIGSRLGSATTSKLVFAADRRLVSIEASSTGQGPSWVKAGIGLAGTIVGAALSFMAPPLGVVAAAGLGVTGVSDFSPEGTADSPVISKYREAHPAEAAAIERYQRALADLTDKHSTAALNNDLPALETISLVLTQVRAEASRLHEHFASWQQRQVVRDLVDVRRIELDLKDVPSRSDVEAMMTAPPVRDRYQKWYDIAVASGIGVSIDTLDSPVAVAFTSGEDSEDDVVIRYRLARDARLTTWRVSAQPSMVARPSGLQFVRVVDPHEETVELRLKRSAWENGKLTVKFNDYGEPGEVGSDLAPLQATAVSELPGAIKDSLETGSALAKALVPGSALEESLKREVSIAEQTAKLADADAAAIELRKLKEAVEVAELKARLALAEAASRTGSPISVIYGG